MNLAPHPLLSPLSKLYAWGSRTRRSLYERGTFRSYRSTLPVLCVGNIVAGGSGKSPVVQYLARLVQSIGRRPVVLSRGYGGSESGPYLVDQAALPETVGDEALMHYRMLEGRVPVVIARKRADGVRYIEKKNLGDVVLLDDGLQHFALERTANILLLDVTDDDAIARWQSGALLPAGWMRETLEEALPRSLCVFFVQKSESRSSPARSAAALSTITKPQFHFSLFPESYRVLGSTERKAIELLRGKQATAVTSIAEPKQFFQMLRTLGIDLKDTISFRDHHLFTPRELANLASTSFPLICTEKDAVKLESIAGKTEISVIQLGGDFSSSGSREGFLALLAPLI